MSSRVKSEVVASSAVIQEEHDDLQPIDVDEMAEDDEIVREIDVYLSPELSNQLYLMQYPLHPRKDLTGPHVARMKPRHNMIELEYPTGAGDDQDGGDTSGRFFMTSRTYSSQTIPVSTHMALGKLVTNDDTSGATPGLHLVPLTRISQMRPNFTHVNEATMNSSSTSEEDLDAQKNAMETANSGRKPLAFQKKESERAALARKSSYAFKKASEESEIWHPLTIHDVGSEASGEILKKICLSKSNQPLLVGATTGTEEAERIESGAVGTSKTTPSFLCPYLQSLNYLPKQNSDVRDEQNNVLDGDGPVVAGTMANVVSRMTRLLHEGWPTPYSVIRAQFETSLTDHSLFRALNTCAFLVRGNFILQSRFLPVPPAVAQARTFVLFLLQTFGIVHRSRLEQAYEGDDQITSEAILMILKQVCKKTEEGWKLKVDEDPSFRRKYPETLPVYVTFWANQIGRFESTFQKYST